MNSNVEKVLKAFRSNPYRIKMGAKTQAKRLKVQVEDIIEARRIFRNPRTTKTRILILDIETSPMKAWVWRRWKENIYLDQTIQEWFMLSWSAKWLGEPETFGCVLTPEEIRKEDDFRILLELYKALNEADIVVAHNGKHFDIPKINTRFILNNMTPVSPYRQIDTLEVARKQFGFSSNSLDALATFFGFENKDPHDFKLWKDCLDGDEKALERLLLYNMKDVEILEKIYLKLRPWIKNHPNTNVIEDSDVPSCPVCSATSIALVRDKSYNTQHYKYPVCRCQSCGAIFRSKKRISSKKDFTSI